MNRPLVLLTVAFGTGIAIEFIFPAIRIVGSLLLALLCLLYAVTRRPYWASCGVILAFVLLGSLRCVSQSKSEVSNRHSFVPGSTAVRGVVESDLTMRRAQENGVRGMAAFTMQVEEIGGERVSNISIDVLMLINDAGKQHRQGAAEFQTPCFGDLAALKGDLELTSGARNPGGFDAEAVSWRRGTSAVLFVSHPEECHILSAGNSRNQPLFALAVNFRNRLREQLYRSLSERDAGVVQGILLGDKSNISSKLREDFERTGTEHILATAGLHVGIVVLLLRGILWRIGIPRRHALIICIAILVLFALMAGGRPAVSRAALIAGIYLASILLEREFDVWNALALAAFCILLWNPFQLLDPGFQLTFATVITIFHLVPFGERFLKEAKNRLFTKKEHSGHLLWSFDLIAGCFFLSVAAQLGSLPLVAEYFHTFSVVSVLANTLAVPLLSIIIPLGFLTAFFSPIAVVLTPIISALIWIIKQCSELKWATFSATSPHPAAICGYYLIIWLGAWKLKARLKETSEEVV